MVPNDSLKRLLCKQTSTASTEKFTRIKINMCGMMNNSSESDPISSLLNFQELCLAKHDPEGSITFNELSLRFRRVFSLLIKINHINSVPVRRINELFSPVLHKIKLSCMNIYGFQMVFVSLATHEHVFITQ